MTRGLYLADYLPEGLRRVAAGEDGMGEWLSYSPGMESRLAFLDAAFALGKPPCSGADAGKGTASAKPPVRGPSAPAAPVRGRPCKADGPAHRSLAPILSAMRPWTPQHNGSQRDKVTHGGTENKRPV